MADDHAESSELSPGAQVASWLVPLVPFFSLGFLSWVPFLFAAVNRRSRGFALATAAYATVVVTSVALVGTPMDYVGTSLIIVVWIGSTIHAVATHRALVTKPSWLADPAVTAARARRVRREEARAILARDPSLASELAIGRPDLVRQYDDGGLIDVNHVPANVLVHALGLDQAVAQRVITARETLGAFTSAEELSIYGELPAGVLAPVADRLLFLPR